MKASFVIFPIISIISSFLGTIVLLRNVKSSRNIYFFFLTIFISIWIISNFLENENIGLSLAAFSLRLDFMVAPLVSLFFILFCLNFPEDRKISNPIKGVIYFFALFFFATASTDLIVKNFSFVGDKLLYSMGSLYSLYSLLHFSYMGLGAYLLLANIFRFKGEKKSQSIYVFLGFFISSGIILILNLTLEQIIFIPKEIARLGIYGLIIFESLTAYAITKHELMDIRVVIGRSLAYGLTGVLLVVSFFAINVISWPRSLAMLFNSALALFWAYYAHRLRTFIQTPLEEKWITDWYDSDRLVNNIARKLVPVLEKGEIFQVVAEEIKAAIKIKSVAIEPDGRESDLKLVKNGLIVPLSSSEKVEGRLILGQKVSEDNYSEKDLTVLRTIMIQSQAVFDRIRPYEQVKNDFEANQKKLYDIERLLARSERLASLGTLAAGVAHEIRNPLGIIHSKTEKIDDEPRDLAYLKEFKEAVLRNSRRITSIITNMLDLAKISEKEMTRTNINDVIESTVQLISFSRVRLIKELKPVGQISAEVEELKQVFINLINNALEAMPDGGDLTISTYEDKRNVYVLVKDTGKGIAKENLPKIFDPFFSTRHDGAGLGLSIVHRIIKKHDAAIAVESESGRGTTFRLTFPVAV